MKKCVLAVLALAASSALAGIIVYDNEAAFVAALPDAYYLEDFVGWTYGNPLNGSQTDWFGGPVNGYAVHAYAPQGLWSNLSALSTNNAYDPLTITFENSPKVVQGFGGIFAATDINGNIINQDVTIKVTATDGETVTVTITGSAFRGFMCKPLASVVIDGVDTPSLNWPQIDHMYTDSPEPASLGLLGLALLLRRR